MRFENIAALNAVDASASRQSNPIDTLEVFFASCQVVSTGTAAGTVKLQFSNDINYVPGNPQNWSDIPSATVSVAGAGTYAIPKLDLCYRWVRVVYTFTSGTGALTATIFTLGG